MDDIGRRPYRGSPADYSGVRIHRETADSVGVSAILYSIEWLSGPGKKGEKCPGTKNRVT